MGIRLPNFLIVGAAKSGTTSLYHYLEQHPEVYMSPLKEPRFITSQFVTFPFNGINAWRPEQGITKTFDEYKRLFNNVKNEKAIGEASIDNLYLYDGAIKYIKKYLGDVKIIIILRNPIERAFSQYVMFIRNLREDLAFEDALKAEEERINNNWVFGYHYKNVSLYSNQVSEYLKNFTNVKIYLYEDLKQNTLGLIKDMYAFLGVDSSFIPNISHKYNISGVPKNKIFHNFITKPHKFKTAIKNIMVFFMPKRKVYKLIEKVRVKNLQKIEMKPETKEYLKEFFREDVIKLQALINRDLSPWLG
ncbi:MAG: sulfotransferase [Candidatus Brocadiaceae bacterium]|nr:sulfotransferase [Candidatus Brocadiaceae bacterium]